MANNQIQIIITAKDEASKVLSGLGGNVDRLNKTTSEAVPLSAKLSQNWGAIAGVTTAAGLGVRSLAGAIGSSISSANTLQSALIGLTSVARAFGQDADKSKQAAQNLAKDGLMTVAQAATGLKNLLASGFSLDQAITLMNRFKDSAAFNRQAALSFGDAVATATEGIKNGNSILVDNAGVTKNLSVILQEAGFSAQDLMRATSDATIRQALFNGIIKETRAQTGDAARLAEQYAGSQAKLTASTETLRQRLGVIFQTALLPIVQAVTPLVTNIANWTTEHQKLTGIIVASTAVFLGLIAVLGVIGTVVGALAPLVAIFGAVTVGVIPLVVALFAGAAVAIIANWTPIKNFFTVTIPNALRAVNDAVLATWNFVKNIDWGGVITSIGKGIGNGLITLIETGLKSALSFLPGNVAGKIHLPRFAQGGVVTSPTLGLFGEDGPEAIIPLNKPQRAQQVMQQAGLTGRATGGVTIHQTNNIYNQVDLDLALDRLGWEYALA